MYYTTKIYFVVDIFPLACSWPSNLTLLQDFLHGAHIFLFDLLTRDFGIPLAGRDLAMPQEVANGDHLRAVFQQVRGKGMPQAMATRRDARGLGVALHLFLDRFDREQLPLTFAIPKDIGLGPFARMLGQTHVETGYRIGGHIHAPIFPPFALHHVEGLLLPIDLLQLELGHLRDTQPTAEHHQKQRAVHGMGDLGKEPLDVLPGEGFGQGAPAPDTMTRLDGIAPDVLLLQTEVKKMLQGIEPAVHGRPRAAMLMLVLHKLVHLAKRSCTWPLRINTPDLPRHGIPGG